MRSLVPFLALHAEALGKRRSQGCLCPQKAQRPGQEREMPDSCNLVTLPLEFSLNRIQILPCGLFMALSVTCHMEGVVSSLQEEPQWPRCLELAPELAQLPLPDRSQEYRTKKRGPSQGQVVHQACSLDSLDGSCQSRQGSDRDAAKGRVRCEQPTAE